jgi:hypothetical protein
MASELSKLDPNLTSDPITLSRSSRRWRTLVGLEYPDRPNRVLSSFANATVHELRVEGVFDPRYASANRPGVDTGPTFPMGEKPRWNPPASGEASSPA